MTRNDERDGRSNAADQFEPVDGFEPPTATRRDVLRRSAATSAALALGLGGAAGTAAGSHDDESDDGVVERGEHGGGAGGAGLTTAIDFVNQFTAGETVVVESVTLSADGYVAIHDESLLRGRVLDSVVGVSEFLEAGTHDSLRIRLFDVPGADLGGRDLDDDDLLVAMPHRETNGNRRYEFVESGGEHDGPFLRAGRPIVDVGYVRVSSEASIEFRNQRTDGESVRVESACLSEGGFVAVHDARLLEGDAAGSVVGVSDYLAGGCHEGVEIELFDLAGERPDRTALERSQPLVAVPYVDSDDDELLDVASGGADFAFHVNGNPVTDLGYVVVD